MSLMNSLNVAVVNYGYMAKSKSTNNIYANISAITVDYLKLLFLNHINLETTNPIYIREYILHKFK